MANLSFTLKFTINICPHGRMLGGASGVSTADCLRFVFYTDTFQDNFLMPQALPQSTQVQYWSILKHENMKHKCYYCTVVVETSNHSWPWYQNQMMHGCLEVEPLCQSFKIIACKTSGETAGVTVLLCISLCPVSRVASRKRGLAMFKGILLVQCNGPTSWAVHTLLWHLPCVKWHPLEFPWREIRTRDCRFRSKC